MILYSEQTPSKHAAFTLCLETLKGRIVLSQNHSAYPYWILPLGNSIGDFLSQAVKHPWRKFDHCSGKHTWLTTICSLAVMQKQVPKMRFLRPVVLCFRKNVHWYVFLLILVVQLKRMKNLALFSPPPRCRNYIARIAWKKYSALNILLLIC